MSLAQAACPAAESDYASWVGRAEDRSGGLTPELAQMLNAAVAHGRSAPMSLDAGAPLPLLWHWSAFNEFVPHAELGTDGHPKLGGFLPPLPFPRRMWAAGRLRFHGQLAIGEPLQRRSEILAVTEKDGATGKMAFVKVGHRITGSGGSWIEEEQDIVYLDIPDQYRPPKRRPVPAPLDFDEPVAMDEARLFRFSAATYNAHRIHIDLRYARVEEKYPSLVVHGPMQAIMLAEAALRHCAEKTPASFEFRGVHPCLLGAGLRLTGTADAAGVTLGAASQEDFLTMTARMEWTG